MLVIRDAQRDVFRKEAIRRFEADMIKWIAGTYPAKYATLGESGAREQVRRGMEFAAKSGMDTERAISGLIELMVEFGDCLEWSPDPGWAHEILSHPALPGILKVEIIREQFHALSQGRVVVPFQGSKSAPAAAER